MASFEPDILRLGKQFGDVVAIEYAHGLTGTVSHEQPAERGSGRVRWTRDGDRWLRTDHGRPPRRRGRTDVRVELHDNESRLPVVVVLEVKNTDWRKQTTKNMRRNLNRHGRQVWRYLEPLVDRVDAGEIAWVQGALVYPERPEPDRTALIEEILGEGEEGQGGWALTIMWWSDFAARARLTVDSSAPRMEAHRLQATCVHAASRCGVVRGRGPSAARTRCGALSAGSRLRCALCEITHEHIAHDGQAEQAQGPPVNDKARERLHRKR